jgi:hypothetical protein
MNPHIMTQVAHEMRQKCRIGRFRPEVKRLRGGAGRAGQEGRIRRKKRAAGRSGRENSRLRAEVQESK